MSKKVLRTSNKVIGFFISLLGVACSGVSFLDLKVAYGTPSAIYILKGTVTSAKDNSPLKGISVVAKTLELGLRADTVKTDDSGNYATKIIALEPKLQVNLSYTDIDGLENGTFQPLDSLISFKDVKFTGGDGKWNQGTAEAVVNIKLKPKP